MKKRTIGLKTGKLGEITQIVPLEGYLEKVEIVHTLEDETVEDAMTELEIISSEDEMILFVVGNENKTYYPRAVATGSGGVPYTYDGNNPVPVRHYIRQFVKVTLKAPEGKVVQLVSFYFTPTLEEGNQ